MSYVGFTNENTDRWPSNSIWADCPNTLLNDKGLGQFRHVDFLGAPSGTLAAALDLTMCSFGDGLSLEGDTDTVLAFKAAELGGYLDIETDGDDNDAAALVGQPFGSIVKNSGKKLWFEARLEVGALADQGVFVGIAEEASASVEVIADNCAAAISTDSWVGGVILAGDTDALDIAYQKDGGTAVTVLADNVIAANTEFKFGFRFDGRDKLYFYFDGELVATQTVDSTVDQAHNFCPVICIKTGTGAAQSISVDWVRYAYQDQS